MIAGERPKAATIVDVAELAGVSISTASRALNGATGVRPHMGEKVRDAANVLGYRPNFSARSLRKSATLSLGVIFNNLDSLTQLDLVRGLGVAIQEQHYSLLVTNARYDRFLYQELAVSMFERGIDGLFLSGPVDVGNSLDCYARAGVPVIGFSLNEPLEALGLPTVCTNETPAVANAVRHIGDAGHRRGACILGRWETSRARLVKSAFSAVGGEVTISFVEPGPPSESVQVASFMRALFLGARPPTVLFTNHAYIPLLWPVLQELQVVVPEQLSVVAFGDSPWLKAVSPSVSAIRSDIEEMGWLSGTLMLRTLQTSEPLPDMSPIQAAEWIVRDSVSEARLNRVSSEAELRD